jgi:hypothetical protein
MATAERVWDLDFVVGRDPSAKLKYLVFWDPITENEAHIEAAIVAAAPSSYAGCRAMKGTFSDRGYGVVQAIVDYGPYPYEDPDVHTESTAEFSFEITVQQVKVLASLTVMSSGVVSGKTIPQNGNLIGVDPKDGKAEGIEVPQATYSFSEVHHFRNAYITTAYKVALAGLVGTCNFGAGFRGFAAGEVLCTGVSGSKQAEDDWKIRFGWSVLPNVVNATVGPLTGISKAGWDYLEWFYDEKENTTNKRIDRELTGYRVHRVLRTGVFSGFGIGS